MKKVLLVIFAGIILWGCDNTSQQTTAVSQEAVSDEDHDHDEIAGAVELNDGERWVINDEMKPFLEKGENLVTVFRQDERSDYKVLADEVKEQNNLLIKSCTMKGKSHDELHKWLNPHLGIVKKLEQETDPGKSAEIVAELQLSYQQFHQYFQ